MGRSSESAGHVNLKAALRLPVHLSNPCPEPEVVYPDPGVVHVLASLEANLEFPAHVLADRVSEHEVFKGFCIWRYVERGGRGNAGLMAGGNVPDGIAAGFARRDADVRELAHHVGNVSDGYEIKLYVLTCGEVDESAGVFIRNVRKTPELYRAHASERDLYTLHLYAFLALGIGAELKAEFLKFDLPDKARQVIFYLPLVVVELLPYNLGKPFLDLPHRLLLYLNFHNYPVTSVCYSPWCEILLD